MSKSGQDKDSTSPEQAARQARLEEALRANLHRRKAQSRARKAESKAEQPDSGGTGHDKD